MPHARRIGFTVALLMSAASSGQAQNYYANGGYEFVHCPPPCTCPNATDDGWFMGNFELLFSHSDAKFDYYLMQACAFTAVNSVNNTNVPVTGSGEYQIEKTWGRVHKMTLWISEDGGPVFTMQSGLVPNEWGGLGTIEIPLTSDTVECEAREVTLWATYTASCYPDCDHDGAGTVDDFICFQTQFALGNPYADCDGDLALTIDDFICFQTFFCCGC